MGEDGGRHGVGLEVWVSVLLELVRQLDHLEGQRRDGERRVDRPAPRGGDVAAGAARLEVGHVCLRVLLDEILGAEAKPFGAFVRAGGAAPRRRAQRDLLK